MKSTKMQRINNTLAAGSWKFLLPALFLLFFTGAQAQVNIAVQGFETPAATPTWTFTPTGGVIAGTNSGVPSSQRIRTGTSSYQVSSGTGTLNFNPVTTTGFSSVVVTVRISSIANAVNFGHSALDTVQVFANLNGAGFPLVPDITVRGAVAGMARWSYNDAQNASTPAGTPLTVTGTDGTDLGTIYSTLRITIPNGTNTVALRIIATNDSTQEIWCVDDVDIRGVGPTAAAASLNGRVVSEFGSPISGAMVSALNTQSGNISYARSNFFGYFSFSGLTVGDFYIVQASGKGYDFPNATTLQLFDDTKGIEIIGQGGR